MTKKELADPIYKLMTDVYKRPVPAQSELSNPFAANKRRRKTSLSDKSNSLSENVEEWNAKDFVHYFSQCYFKNYNATYKITYSSDCSVISEIQDFMSDNSLEVNSKTREFIDWCFDNKALISTRTGYFFLVSTRQFLNRYYQDKIISQNPNHNLLDFFNDVESLYINNRSKEIYSKYGIPIASTFLINKKNIDKEKVKSGLIQWILSLSSGNNEQRKMLTSILQKSISRSPYIDNFELLDWRDVLNDVIEKFKNESWWREEDYPGSPRFKFDKFLKNE